MLCRNPVPSRTDLTFRAVPICLLQALRQATIVSPNLHFRLIALCSLSTYFCDFHHRPCAVSQSSGHSHVTTTHHPTLKPTCNCHAVSHAVSYTHSQRISHASTFTHMTQPSSHMHTHPNIHWLCILSHTDIHNNTVILAHTCTHLLLYIHTLEHV